MAAIAPEGTSWARELKAFARDVHAGTSGALQIKWYLGGIAGDELAAVARVQKGQLDGAAGAIFCGQLAPSLRVARVPGLFYDREEPFYVIGRLRAAVDAEFRKSGFTNLGEGGFGSDALFLRGPLKSVAELLAARLWVWNLDVVWPSQLSAMGGHPVPSSLEDAARAFEEQRTDGFIAVPTAALAYQWSSRTHYYADLDAAWLIGCMVMSNTTFDSLPLDQQQAVRTASAKFFVRFNDLGRTTDAALLGGLFEKQGLKKLVVNEHFRDEFRAAARAAYPKLAADLVSPELLKRVEGWLAEHRAGRKGAKAP
jgi:TRAP-type C4-dicarboxylate transport system substrate-binding protein